MITFAIVEDEWVEREFLQRFIESSFPDASVLWSAPDGASALAMAAEQPPDVMIVDLNMPVMDGLTLCEKLGEQAYEGSILINTAYDDSRYVRRALRSGAVDYLVKPSSNEEMRQAIRRAMDKAQERQREHSFLTELLDDNDNRHRYSDAYLFERIIEGKADDALFSHYGWPSGEYQTVIAWTSFTEALRGKQVISLLSVRCSQIYSAAFRADPNHLALLMQPGFEMKKAQWQTASLYLGYALKAAYPQIQSISLSGSCHSPAEINETIRSMLNSCAPEPGVTSPLRHSLSESKHQVFINSLVRHMSEGKIRFVAKGLRTLWNRLKQEDPDAFWLIVAYFIIAADLQQQLTVCSGALDRMIFGVRETDDAVFDSWLDMVCDSLRSHKPQEGSQIQDILQIMNESYATNLSQSVLAQRLGMNPTYFSRYFKAQTGQRFIDVLTEIRIRHAIEMLMQNPDATLAQLANGCGFYSKAHFSEVFKKCVGKTVSQYLQEDLQQGLEYDAL